MSMVNGQNKTTGELQSSCNGHSEDEPLDEEGHSFVEMDPNGRYGRVSSSFHANA
jgi:hypothetical protein